MKFRKELYSKVALIKAAYNFTDRAYIHLDADENYFYVSIGQKDPNDNLSEEEFINEMLAQSVRHEIYKQTKDIRELTLARAMATSLIVDKDTIDIDENTTDVFEENEILNDWFEENEENKN